MSEQIQPPKYMANLLEQLGWSQGTRIPLADEENQALESLLISRQNEIQKIKEALVLQNQKTNDLKKYKEHVHSEHQENTRLLFAHKQQLEQEVKLQQLSYSEVGKLERDIIDSNKENKDISERFEKHQTTIARLLKKADVMKVEVCGERGALQEWRAALERRSCDIEAIEQFTKQDASKVKALDVKKNKLQNEHDKLEERLHQLIGNFSAEERACERVSLQVIEGMEQRKQMMQMWRSAVENLRQRDTDIRHTREDYAVLEEEAAKLADKVREQQGFCKQQIGNNEEARRENIALSLSLSNLRVEFQRMQDAKLTLDSEVQCLQRELANLRQRLEKLRMENRRIIDEQRRKDNANEELNYKLEELKEKIKESLDKSKSSEKRAKELEDMLNEEEHYTNQLTVNQQRAMHCSFIEQQKLLALKNDEKLFNMQLKASKAIMNKLETRKNALQKNLQIQRESLYTICYQLETAGSKVLQMEGVQAERDFSAELVEKEGRIRDVLARHTARVTLLDRHTSMLHDDMRVLAREVDLRTNEHIKMKNRLKMALLTCNGSEKELQSLRECWRRERVEEALTRVKVAHATRAVAGLDDTAYSLDAQRLQLRAAMNERLVEIEARREVFNFQKRALIEDVGKLNSSVREREQRVEQLKKRYDIFIATLGKDDSGGQMSVSFFKIKVAAQRAELRGRGAALDAELARRERDVRALEATLRLVHAAHHRFLRAIAPLQHCDPEMQELESLTKQYYEMRDELKQLNNKISAVEELLSHLTSKHTILKDMNKQLTVKQAESEADLEGCRERQQRQEERLQNARAVVKQNKKRARYLVSNQQQWKYFQLSVWTRDYDEAAFNAFNAMHEACMAANAIDKFAALVISIDLLKNLTRHQKKFSNFIERLCSGTSAKDVSIRGLDVEVESVLTTSSESIHSGVSVASGFTKRLSAFRRDVALKVQEPALIDELPEIARRSTVSLRVVTLGLVEGKDFGSKTSTKIARRKSHR